MEKTNFFSRIAQSVRYDFKKNKWLIAMSIPGLVFIILFRYVPMGGLVMAFQNFSLFLGISGSEWIGFTNFARFFNDPFFTRTIINTFLLGVLNLIWGFPMPIILALALNELKSNKFRKATQTITYLPYFISAVIIVGIMRTVFASEGGVVNGMLTSLGAQPIAFFNEPGWFRPLYIFSDIWQNVGYNSIIYLAAITSIDTALYEAAKIDGASRFQCIYKITLPCLIPTIAVLLTMRFGSILSVGFEKILLMYSPATYSTADVISTYVYRKGMLDQDFGYASAVGLFNSIVAVILLTGGNFISRHVFKESLW